MPHKTLPPGIDPDDMTPGEWAEYFGRPEAGKDVGPTVTPPADALDGFARLEEAVGRLERLLYLSFAAQTEAVTDVFVTRGSEIGNDINYRVLFNNDTEREVKVQVSCAWGKPGDAIKLATQPNDAFKIEELANSSGGKSESGNYFLRPQKALYVAARSSSVTLSENTIIRVRVFDPQTFLSGGR